MKTRFLFVFATLLLSLIARADAVEIDGIYFNLSSNGDLNIAEVTYTSGYFVGYGHNEYSGDIVIPEHVTYGEIVYSVTSIGPWAFQECPYLTSVTIPNSVISISDFAFESCTGLTTITIPNGVTSIGQETFCDCTGLTSVTIHSNVTSIGNAAFMGCSSLTDVYFMGESAPSANNAFSKNGVKDVSLHVKDYAIESFKGVEPWIYFKEIVCDEILKDFKLTYYIDGEEFKTETHKYDDEITPESEPSKKGMTFSGWSDIPEKMPGKDVGVTGTFSWSKVKNGGVIYEVSDTINNNAAVISNDNASGDVRIVSPVKFDYDYSITDIIDFVFKNNTEITSVVIPGSVRKIGDEAFYGCKNLAKIELGKSVNQIEPRAFAGIDKLTDVTCYAEDVPDADRTAFENSYIEDYVTLHVPAGSLEKYKAAAPWKNFKEIVAIEGTETEPAKYTLIYQVDGETYQKYELEEGAEVTALEEPTKEGYTFSGWDNVPETMPAEDVIIKGTFTQNESKGEESKQETENTDIDEIVIKDIGKTTWCSEYDLDFTNVEGIKAYTATGYDNKSKTIWLTRVMTVPAGTGILVKGDAGTYKVPRSTEDAYYTNMFKGNIGDPIKIEETEGDMTNYYLSGKDGSFVSVNGSANIGKNKAYLQLPTKFFAGTRSIGVTYDDESTTGIWTVGQGTLNGDHDVWFNLQGQRVDKPRKGLYIRNGKKVIVR